MAGLNNFDINKCKVGIALAGGFARGASQIGFMKALFEVFPRDCIKAISGSSIGVVSGLAFQCNKIDELIDIYKDFQCKNLFSLRKQLGNGYIKNVLNKLFTSSFTIPFYVTLCKFPKLSAHYYKLDKDTPKQRIEKIIDVALTYPIVNGILKILDKKIYLDGGLVDNNPIYPLLYEDLDLIILLHCDSHFTPNTIMVDSKTIIIDVNVTLHNQGRNGTFSIRNKELNEMLDGGYNYGKNFVKEIFEDCNSTIKLQDNVHKFIQREAVIRKHKTSWLTIVNFFNFIHWNKDFK